MKKERNKTRSQAQEEGISACSCSNLSLTPKIWNLFSWYPLNHINRSIAISKPTKLELVHNRVGKGVYNNLSAFIISLDLCLSHFYPIKSKSNIHKKES